MKRMGNHGGSIGSQHQIQGSGLGMGSSSGQNLMSESYQQGEVTPRPVPRVSSALCRERRHPEEAWPVLPAGEGAVGGQAELLQPEQPGQPHQRPHDGRGRPRARAQV